MPVIKSLRSKVLLSALIPSAIAFAATAAIVAESYETSAREIAGSSDVELARLLAERVGDSIDRVAGELSRAAERLAAEPIGEKPLSEMFDRRVGSLRYFDGGLYYYDQSGTPNLKISDTGSRKFEMKDMYLNILKHELRPLFSNIFISRITGEPEVMIMVPVINRDGKFLGVLGGCMSLKYSPIGARYAELLERDSGDSWYAYIVDGNGRIIYHRYRNLFGEKLPSAQVKRAAVGRRGYMFGYNEQNREYLSAFSPTPVAGWWLVTQREWGRVAGPIRAYGKSILAFIIISAIVSSILIYLATNRSLRQVHELAMRSRNMAEGNFTRPAISGSGDEIAELADRFNAMSEALEGTITDLQQRYQEKVEAEARLEEYKDKLSELVRERTAELEEAQNELIKRERLSLLGQFTAAISHEIRNPLGTVRNSIFSIKEGVECDNSERVNRAIGLAERNINRCDRIIEELVDFTRIEKMEFSRIRIDRWLQGIIDDYSIGSDVEMITELTAGAEVEFDSINLHRAVDNLIRNSQQAFDGVKKEKKRILISSALEDGKILIKVEDNGDGISPDIIGRIFDPLFSTKNFGIGLGLLIVKNVMEQHHGGVEIFSDPGERTVATIWLPVSRKNNTYSNNSESEGRADAAAVRNNEDINDRT